MAEFNKHKIGIIKSHILSAKLNAFILFHMGNCRVKGQITAQSRRKLMISEFPTSPYKYVYNE
jgi:hypothetical protein